MIEHFKRVANNPATKEVLKSLKPQKNLWGIFSVVVLFILPEIVAFLWGDAITAYTQAALSHNLPLEKEYYYKGLEMLFAKGSWFNLIFGFGLLIWLFF